MSLARALVKNSKIIILDEATGELFEHCLICLLITPLTWPHICVSVRGLRDRPKNPGYNCVRI